VGACSSRALCWQYCGHLALEPRVCLYLDDSVPNMHFAGVCAACWNVAPRMLQSVHLIGKSLAGSWLCEHDRAPESLRLR
jgi:hypothetical protein